MLFKVWFVHDLISFSSFSFIEAELLMACLVCLLLWPSRMYSRKFGARLRRKFGRNRESLNRSYDCLDIMGPAAMPDSVASFRRNLSNRVCRTRLVLK